MNKKGFTLIELLAVIVLLGIILVLVAPNVMNIYQDSKLKGEEIFVDRLSQEIDSYVKLTSANLNFIKVDTIATKKEENKLYQVTVYETTKEIQDIINENLMSSSDYINAGNKNASCNKNAKITIYRDSDYVYCYKVEKDSLGCLTDLYKKQNNGKYAIDTCIWEWSE